MRGKVLLLLASLWGAAFAQGDPWAFVDEATQVYRDEKTGYEYKNAVACAQPNTKDFLSSCLSKFFRGPEGEPFYVGERFSLGTGDRLELEVALSSLEWGTLFARELTKAEVKGVLETLYSNFVSRSGSVGGWSLKVYVPRAQPKETEGLCSLYAEVAALRVYLTWLIFPISSPIFSKVEVLAYRGGGPSAAVFLADMKGGENTKATLVAFPKAQGSGFAWKGMYGEPFTRSFVPSYKRIMRTGTSLLCQFPQ